MLPHLHPGNNVMIILNWYCSSKIWPIAAGVKIKKLSIVIFYPVFTSDVRVIKIYWQRQRKKLKTYAASAFASTKIFWQRQHPFYKTNNHKISLLLRWLNSVCWNASRHSLSINVIFKQWLQQTKIISEMILFKYTIVWLPD